MTSHIRKEPHFGLGRLKYDPELHWLFCESDAAVGLRSNAGGHMDMLTLGVVLHPPGVDQHIDLDAAARLRKATARLKLLDRVHQHVLQIWYTRRQLNGKATVSETQVAAAHKAWREI